MIKFDVWSRRASLALIGIALTATLAACGGGGGSAGGSVFDGGSSASSPSGAASGAGVAADLVVLLSKNSLSNTGTDSLTVTVTAIDSSNGSVADVPVSFAVDGNAIITKGGSVTSTNGQQTATVTEGSDTTVRVVNVTVTSRSITRTVAFNVVQSVATSTPQAARLDLTLNTFSIGNAGSTPVTATATALDANNNALVGIPVQISVDSSAIAVVSGPQTDANGKVTGQVTIGSDHSNRTITVTATSGTLVKTAAFKVTGATLNVTGSLVATASMASNTITFTLVDQNQNAMIGQPITVVASGLPTATSTTDVNGSYVYSYTAPSAAGTITISANAGGVAASASVTVSVPGGVTTIPNATATPTAATLQISPNVVAVNGTGTSNQASVTANFVDSSNNVVKNVRVRFDVNDTAYSTSNQYGALSSSLVVYSDASGNASTLFVPSSIASPTNGVTIRACWSTADFATGTCPNSVVQTLTVAAAPVSITIGTDDTVATGTSTLTYVKKYVLLVVDAAGNPKSDVQITPSIDLGGFQKGTWEWGGTSYVQNITALCPNEDFNRNFLIDGGEDRNNNDQLDPRKSEASITMVGSTKTDANGVAVLQIEYPQNVASWVKFKITASAGGVSSPPAYYPLGKPIPLPSNLTPDQSTYDQLPVPLASLITLAAPPAFRVSPYGVVNDCTSKN